MSLEKDYSKPLSLNEIVLIQIRCKCLDKYLHENLTYNVKHNDMYINIPNQTFKGLNTCQAMQAKSQVLQR